MAETPERPDVSVILCVRNGERTIRRQLDAVVTQRSEHPFELIVVDNGSTDATARIVENVIAETRGDPPVRLIDGGQTPGLPQARNCGARAARGRVLAFCDADDEIQPGWVRAFSEAIDGDILVGGTVIAVGADGTVRPPACIRGYTATPYLPHVPGASFAIPREAYFAVGGFDESLPHYGYDDVDFSWRVQEAGIPVGYAEDAVVRFTLSGNATSVRKRFFLGMGRVLMARRYPAYDSRHYGAPAVLADAARMTGRLVSSAVRHRTVDRRAVSQLCVSGGQLAGVIRYGIRGMPERRLATDSLASDQPR
ncbi:MAG: glycosyltransferase [Bowdeniella nasicola]|nr:glycosyltransferase [Bowdeniella nasicola]